MKNELLVFAASLALVSSMSASVNNSNTKRTAELSNHGRLTLIAREGEPDDQRRGRGKDDKKGHKLTQEMARETEPGDDRGRGHRRGRGRGNDDGTGHKAV